MIPLNLIKDLKKEELNLGIPLHSELIGKEFNKQYFTELNEKKASTTFAIDGGCAVLVDAGTWTISKIKIGIVSYTGLKKDFEQTKDYYLKIIQKKDYELKLFDELGQDIKIDFPDFSKFDIDELQSKVMKILEWKTCLNLCNQNKKLLILIDGGIEPDNEVEQETINQIKKTDNTVIGFCKTSRMRTTTGRNVLGVVNGLSEKKKSWYYYPLFNNEKETFTLIGKLHNHAKSCHKIQLFNLENINEIFNILCFFCNDSEIIGYPYPLLKVDKIARINSFEKKKEKNFAEKELKKSNIFEDVQNYEFHSNLDNRMYR